MKDEDEIGWQIGDAEVWAMISLLGLCITIILGCGIFIYYLIIYLITLI